MRYLIQLEVDKKLRDFCAIIASECATEQITFNAMNYIRQPSLAKQSDRCSDFVLIFAGDVCPVVGRISMDGITIKIHDDVTECQELYVMKDDFNSTNSIISLAKLRNSIPCETCTNFGTRLPRLYIQGGRKAYICK